VRNTQLKRRIKTSSFRSWRRYHSGQLKGLLQNATDQEINFLSRLLSVEESALHEFKKNPQSLKSKEVLLDKLSANYQDLNQPLIRLPNSLKINSNGALPTEPLVANGLHRGHYKTRPVVETFHRLLETVKILSELGLDYSISYIDRSSKNVPSFWAFQVDKINKALLVSEKSKTATYILHSITDTQNFIYYSLPKLRKLSGTLCTPYEHTDVSLQEWSAFIRSQILKKTDPTFNTVTLSKIMETLRDGGHKTSQSTVVKILSEISSKDPTLIISERPKKIKGVDTNIVQYDEKAWGLVLESLQERENQILDTEFLSLTQAMNALKLTKSRLRVLLRKGDPAIVTTTGRSPLSKRPEALGIHQTSLPALQALHQRTPTFKKTPTPP
jgi:hypothetical protein